MAKTISELNSLSLSKIGKLFYTLSPIDVSELNALYRAEFIGPLWLRITAGPALSLTGLRGWWGKEFVESTIAYNLVATDSGRIPKLQMAIGMAPSPFDGKRTVQLTYSFDAPIPWRYVTDELRWLDERRILAMTYVNRPLFYRIAFPFLLSQQENN